MEVLVYEREAHFAAAELAAAFPTVVVHDARTHAQALTFAGNASVLVALAHEITDELIAAMPKLEWIFALSTGVDNLWKLTSLHPFVRVTNGRGIHGPQMAELAFLFMIGLARNYARMQSNREARVWDRWPQPVLVGKTVVILGIGAISEAVAQRCKAFDMRVVGVSNARSGNPGFDLVMPRARLHEALATADFVIVLVPLDNTTRGMVGAAALAAMRPTAFLINLARGDVIDEAALIAALQNGGIAGAGLDVFSIEPPAPDNPLWDMPNVMLTPRIGGMSDIYADQVFPVVANNLQALCDGRAGDMRNVVRAA